MEITSKDLKKILRKYQTPLAKVMKKVIKEKDLIDSGLMYETVGVLYNEEENQFKVLMQDYFKYLDIPYEVTVAFDSHPDYLKILRQIEEDITKLIEDKLLS